MNMSLQQIETLQERQENEFKVLQSIYMGDLQDLRDDEIQRPPEFQITLTPQESMGVNQDIHVMVDLHVKFGEKYPETIPELSMTNAKGLSNSNLKELVNELTDLANKLKGEVMIFELAQHVKNFLHRYNLPRFNSFYDEMISNRQKQQEELEKEELRRLELQKMKKEKQLKVMEEEIQRKQEALKEEARWRKDSTRFSSSTEENSSSNSLTNFPSRTRARSIEAMTATPGPGQGTPINRRRQTSVQFIEPADMKSKECQHSNTATVTFNNKVERIIQRGKCLVHGPHDRVSFVGMDTKTGELVMVSEFVLKWKLTKLKEENTKIIDNYLKQVNCIEKELNSLLRLKYKGLVHYLGMKSFVEKDKIIIHMLQEFVNGRSMNCTDGAMSLEALRHYTIGVVDALIYLHEKSVVHRDLKFTNIFLENSGAIKVSDYCVHKRLCDLIESTNEDTGTNSLFPPMIGRGGKKTDIYRLGFILLSLATGTIVTDFIPKIPSSLPTELSDFLKKCLIRDEQDRWSAEQLENHLFLKPSIENACILKANCDNMEEQQCDEAETRDKDIPLVNMSSRLKNEFEVLKWLGKGGFGDVLKVRNKLDGRVYAIKRIVLNQHNKLLNKKITREVKLLSRLNHENVVRYFYSWIETVPVDNADESTSESTISGSSPAKNITERNLSTTEDDDLEKFAPPKIEGSLEWSVSHERSHVQNVDESNSSEDEDEEEEDYVFGPSFFLHADSSGGVVFESNGKSQDSVAQSSNNDSKVNNKDETMINEEPKSIQFMYIQMEFCEKSTLRNAIDMGLYEDENRVWRLFREMVEGLAHIHQQGMIHRDLKPVNIFLDSNDHVKIGDFGLATTDIITKSNVLDSTSTTADLKITVETIASRSDPIDDGTLTGRVGTALYVAPEISTVVKMNYSQKVDIYSVGIIFFEMCCKPFPTGMERVKILSNIRLPEITFPSDFDEDLMYNQAHIIRWLLSHDVDKRPTSLELLQSEYLPPPEMEETELQEMLRHTINNPQSKSYKHMISTLFQQELSPAADFIYDMDYFKGSFNSRLMLTQKFVRNELSKIYQRHGALNVITSLIMPNSSFYENNDVCVKVVDHSGAIVLLPYELKMAFARYIVKNNIINLKRYAISRVYRERKVFGFQPRELFECAFDIVTPTPGSLIADAEILAIVSEVINEFPALQSRSYMIQMNHTCLIKAILIYCGIPEEKHRDVYSILGDPKMEKCNKFQMQTKLLNLYLSVQTIDLLYNFIEQEGSLSKISNSFKSIITKKGPASSIIKEGLQELELIITHAEAFGVKPEIVIRPGLVYALHQFSGVFFKVVCELKRKNNRVCLDVIAAGGRYDTLISSIRHAPSFSNIKGPTQSAVGVSFSLEKITSAILEDEEFKPPSAFDVLVCSVGRRVMSKEKANITRDLWNAGIKAHMIYDSTLSLEEMQNMCRESGISHIVLLKDTETGFVRIRSSCEKDRFTEKKLSVSDFCDYLQKTIGDSQESFPLTLNRTEITKTLSTTEQFTSSSNRFTISFFSQEKLALNTRRRYEGQISAHVASALQYLAPKICVQIVAVELNSQVLKTIASHIELDEAAFDGSLSAVYDKHPRHRKYLKLIFDEIRELKFHKKNPVVMLYGLTDNSYKLLI